jgi:hypothetical protein
MTLQMIRRFKIKFQANALELLKPILSQSEVGRPLKRSQKLHESNLDGRPICPQFDCKSFRSDSLFGPIDGLLHGCIFWTSRSVWLT